MQDGRVNTDIKDQERTNTKSGLLPLLKHSSLGSCTNNIQLLTCGSMSPSLPTHLMEKDDSWEKLLNIVTFIVHRA